MNRLSYVESRELPPQQGGRREYVAVHDVLNLVLDNILVFVAAIALALTLAAVYYSVAVPSYRAQAQLMLDPKLPQIFRQASDLGLAVDTGQIETHMVVLKSRVIAAAVVSRLGLSKDPEFQRAPSRLGALSVFSRQAPAAGDPAQIAADILLENLHIEREGISQVINVTYRSRDREKAARLANEVTRAYIQYLIDARADAARSASEWLEERLQQLRLQMNAAAKRTQNFRANSESATLEELQLSAETYRKVYQDFYSAFTEAVQRESYPVSTVRVISVAAVPLRPASPNPVVVFGSAMLVAIGGALLFALLRDSRRARRHVPAPRAPRAAS